MTAEVQVENLTESIGSSDNTDKPKNKGGRPKGSVNRQGTQIARIEIMLNAWFTGSSKIVGRINPMDGAIIAMCQKDTVASILLLCEEDKNVREYLLMLSSSSAWLSVGLNVGTMLFLIASNHNLIPPLFAKPAAPSVMGNGLPEGFSMPEMP